jgi:hypothetical protein
VSAYSRPVDRGNERLRRLLDAEPAVSLHDHPFRYPAPRNSESWCQARLQKRLVFAYNGMAGAGMGATVASTNSWQSRDETLLVLSRLRSDLNHHDGVLATRPARSSNRSPPCVRALPHGPDYSEAFLLRRTAAWRFEKSWYEPFSADGSSYNLLIGNGAIDPTSGWVPHLPPGTRPRNRTAVVELAEWRSRLMGPMRAGTALHRSSSRLVLT